MGDVAEYDSSSRSWIASPRSPIFTHPPRPRRTFAGLTSRWTTRYWCRCARPRSAPTAARRKNLAATPSPGVLRSASDASAKTNWSREPAFMYSKTRPTASPFGSANDPKNLRTWSQDRTAPAWRSRRQVSMASDDRSDDRELTDRSNGDAFRALAATSRTARFRRVCVSALTSFRATRRCVGAWNASQTRPNWPWPTGRTFTTLSCKLSAP
mmetsp:Transcript_31362/g.97050  ORF Transcript_31362/g.97050 Transcript_31362/m.97050 type:complete len:212 (-) Transcript_31362:439-1074(-)